MDEQDDTTTPHPARPARDLLKRALLAAVIVIFASATAVTATGMIEIDRDTSAFLDASDGPGFNTDVLDGVDQGGPQTILLLGADKRWGGVNKGDPVRSDTMMLVRLDPDRGATAVMSIPRDLKVDIPGYERDSNPGDHKINAAMALGGPSLAVKTVRKLLGVPVNHVVVVNFRGFRRAVDRLGCIYTDVDRRYFNDNAPPNGGGTPYAVIDVKAGYQRLCGQDALDYVRYRHTDTDIVRAARQQQFLTDAKNQIGLGRLVSDREDLLKIFGRYTQTDIRSQDAILRLLKLTLASARQPIQEVRFPGKVGESFVTIGKTDLDRTVQRFMETRGSSSPRGKAKRTQPKPRKVPKRKRTRGGSTLPAGMLYSERAAQDIAIRLAPRARFPVLYPKALVNGASYLDGDSRAYDLYDQKRRKHRAYRIVVRTGELGQYYGLQGTTWLDPPILRSPSERRKIGGRTYELFKDGGRLRIVAWRSGKNRYWVSNTLLLSLPSDKMLALARSVGRVT